MALAAVAVTLAAIMAMIYLPQSALRPTAAPDNPYTRAEFVTIVLTALTAVLAALAIVVALVAAIGYVQIKNAAKSAAGDIARDAAERIAKEVAETVAVREAEKTLSTLRQGDSEAADQIAMSQSGEGGHDAGKR
jgi:hypothetical protein